MRHKDLLIPLGCAHLLDLVHVCSSAQAHDTLRLAEEAAANHHKASGQHNQRHCENGLCWGFLDSKEGCSAHKNTQVSGAPQPGNYCKQAVHAQHAKPLLCSLVQSNLHAGQFDISWH